MASFARTSDGSAAPHDGQVWFHGDGVQHLVGSNDRGQAFFFARNDLNDSEFTGAELLLGPQDDVRVHPVARPRLRDQQSI